MIVYVDEYVIVIVYVDVFVIVRVTVIVYIHVFINDSPFLLNNFQNRIPQRLKPCYHFLLGS